MVRMIIFVVITLGLLLCSCSQATIQPIPTLIPTGLLTPYHTLTPTSISPISTSIAVIQVTPDATPTPFMHTVKKEETMLGIAFQYGVSLDDLKAANPKVDPLFLSVGIQLIIPLSGEIPQSVPTPTPIPVEWQQPKCYRTGDGGAWCILPVRNQLETSVENLSAWIGLFTPDGTNIASQVAYAGLNLAQPDSTIPLMSYFSPPLPEEFQARGEILSGLAISSDDARYLNLETNVAKLDISLDGRLAVVFGEVILPEDISFPSQLWVLIVAYDANGNIIGARKWESTGESQFELAVYSLAGIIDHVEVLTEVRP